jgi:hypothetical protein
MTPARRALAELLFACVLLVVATGCKGAGDESGAGEPEAAEPAPAAAEGRYTVEAADGSEVARIELGPEITITFGGKTLRNKSKGDKRRYEMDGELVAVAKGGADKIKLEDAAGKLLWKIKFKDDKIKVSDNEENEGGYSLKPKGDDVKVKKGEDEIGKVKFYADDGRIKVKDATGAEQFKAKTAKASAMWGVLLMKDIPEPQRFVVMAEIGARGR